MAFVAGLKRATDEGALPEIARYSPYYAGLKRATDEGSLPEIAQYSPYYLPLNVFIASKGSNIFIFNLLSLQLVLCRVAALKSLHVHHP